MTDAGPPDDLDTGRVNAARLYDYLLGGAHNFAVDRAGAEELIRRFPAIVDSARANRSFLVRAVRHCLDRGVDQFLDLGSGIPTVGNVHEVALDRFPAARVAYVDIEPVAVAHSRELLRDATTVSVTHADLRRVDTVLAAPGVADLLDFSRPVAVLAVAALHFVADDEDPAGILARYLAALAPGSVLVLSHNSADHDDPALVEDMRSTVAVMADSATPLHPRSRAELRALLAGVELVEPGLVPVSSWRAEEAAGPSAPVYGAVGLVR